MNSSRPFTRRSFIKTAAIAGAAPLILRSGLLAQNAPSKKITLGFIGHGAQGRGLLGQALPRNDVRVLAIADCDTTRRNVAKASVERHYAEDMTSGTYKGCDTYSNFEELLARKDIDAVVIATPDHWHALIAIAAANAGKDIYCEKPMAHTVLEGRGMVNAVRKNNRVFQTGSMQRSSGEFRAACELVRNGVIGKISRVDVNVGGPPQVCDLPTDADEPGLDWDRWQGPAALRPYSAVLSPRGMPRGFPDWRKYREYGSGGVGDWGAHHFDIAQWGLGHDDSGPVEFSDPPSAGNGVKMTYADGVELYHNQSREIHSVVFSGDKGKVQVGRGEFHLYLGDTLKSDKMDDYSPLLKELLPADAVRLYHSTNHMSDWIRSIGTRKPPICDVEIGQRTATICNLLNAVYIHGKGCKWDPKTESFTGGTGDPSWLTREYRAPWKLA
jgi:predicted dehydrogenase